MDIGQLEYREERDAAAVYAGNSVCMSHVVEMQISQFRKYLVAAASKGFDAGFKDALAGKSCLKSDETSIASSIAFEVAGMNDPA